VIRIEQTRRGRDNSVPIGIRIVAEGNIETILELNKSRHCPWTRTIHPDFSIVVNGHERERWIDIRVHHCDVEAVAFRNRGPIGHSRASERIDSYLHPGRTDRFHVDNVRQILHVACDKVLGVCRRRLEGRLEGSALDAFVAAAQQFVCTVLNPVGDVGIGRPSVGRIVFETSICRRVV
jgi:hypothetical protein